MVKKLVGNFSVMFLILSVPCAAQWFQPIDRKGVATFCWGWNTAAYTDSDIHFTGDEYDFTLTEVPAHDRPTPFSARDYLRPDRLTIPQTNLRFGYFIGKNLCLTGGVDHMKYVMQNDVTVGFEGYLNDSVYAGMIENDQVFLDRKFLTFEHTDGLNYINFELEYHFGIFQNKNLQWNILGGAGAGAMLPKSNVRLMEYPRNDEFHLAGYGIDLKLGTEVILFDYFFIRTETKRGFINLTDILTRGNDVDDRASQHFAFAQHNFMFGVSLPLVHPKTQHVE